MCSLRRPVSEQEPQAPLPCLACRETGKVISTLGGAPKQVTCPWCEGAAVVEPGHDAQQAGARLRGEPAASD